MAEKKIIRTGRHMVNQLKLIGSLLLVEAGPEFNPSDYILELTLCKTKDKLTFQ